MSAMMLAAGAPPLVPGEYSVDVTCLNASSTRHVSTARSSSSAMTTTAAVAMVTDSHNLTVVAPAAVGMAPPLVSIDEQSRVIINGTEAFFPVSNVCLPTPLASPPAGITQGGAVVLCLLCFTAKTEILR